VIGAPALKADPRFRANGERMANLPALVALLSEKFRTRTTAEWLQILEDAGVPAGPVLTVGEMHADPQARAREMVVKVEHGGVGPVETIGAPVKLSHTPASVRRGAPRFGEHTREVLRSLGYGDAEIDRMAKDGAIADFSAPVTVR
jgi:crotonobetainyl-CoA:carnitine CoA-transferase CaiB-like acyl-CoA transferase